MSASLMISALAQGNTGDQILQILDALTTEQQSNTIVQDCQVTYKNSPTLDVINFWDYQQFL